MAEYAKMFESYWIHLELSYSFYFTKVFGKKIK